MNCPRCHQEVATDAKFCNQCGLSVSSEMPAATVIAPPLPADPPEDPNLKETKISPTPQPSDALTGRKIEAKYELMELLGEGAMGSVYRARRLRIGDQVAIKILHQKFLTEDSAVERFQREAQAAAMLHHPNVVGIYDYGEEPDQDIPAFIVMELVAGQPLRTILDREKRIKYQRAVALMQTACAGVGAAHRRHIVHRDIKPDNLIVLPPESEGESETIKVVDFGIAKLRNLTSGANLTQTGIVMGTPYYMSPEQCRGDSLDARSDVYSLGATLYEMLAGNPPFTAATATGVVAKHLTEPPPVLPSTLGVPPALEAAIRRALAKDPNARQADAIAFGKELQAALATSATVPNLSAATMPNQDAARTEVWGGSTNQAPNYPPYTQPGAPYNSQSQPFPYPQPTGQAQKKPFKGMLYINIIASAVVLAALGGGIWWAMQNKREAAAPASATYPAPANNPNGNLQVTPNPQNPVAAGNPAANRNNRNETPQTTPGIPPALPSANSNTSEQESPKAANAEAVERKILAGERVTSADIAGLPKLRLRVLRNTVYARHGRIFDTPEMRAYFNRQSWYQPNPGFRDSLLTAIDKANVETIKEEEQRR